MLSAPTAIHEAFQTAFNSGDLEGLVALYESDAVLVMAPPDAPAKGLDAIREAYRGFLAMKPTIQLETISGFEPGDGLALLHGKWTITGTGPEGPLTMEGRNTEVVRRQPDGTWLFVIDNPFAP